MERRLGCGQNRRRVQGSTASPLRTCARAAGLAAALLAVAAAAAAGAVQGWRAIASADALRIREIRFRGLVRASADELLARSPIRPGDHLLLSDTGALHAAVARHPWVSAAEVRRRWPPALEVTVRERTAAALVDLGGLYLVEADGTVFKRAGAGDGLDLPVVTGLSRADYLERRASTAPLLHGALALAAAWRTSRRDTELRLAEIHVDPAGNITLYLGDDGVQVRLGAGDLAAKLARLDRVLALLRAEGRKADVLHLDNRVHPSWVTVRVADADGGPGPAR